MSLIYEPKGRAREYAALACNIYRGCDHGCVYCYAPAATHVNREQFDKPEQRNGFLDKLCKEAVALTPTEPILLCFSCDPYSQLDAELALTRETIKILHSCGHAIHVLTKGGTRALRDLDLFSKRDAFATTLTWLDASDSFAWEPGAALPEDRIEAIKRFAWAGIPTWVSLEPVLDPEIALDIIGCTHPWVSLFKIGTWNYDERAKRIDWRKFGHDAVKLCESLGKAYYLKRDLREKMDPEDIHTPEVAR